MKNLFFIVLFLSFVACQKQEEADPSSSTNGNNTSNNQGSSSGYSGNSSNSNCENDQSKRRGAKCKDGTESTATGSGACSGHGGVNYWLCK